jgi:hypothetical protein
MYGMASTQTKQDFFSKKVEEGEVDTIPLPFIDLLPNMLQIVPPDIHHQFYPSRVLLNLGLNLQSLLLLSRKLCQPTHLL